MATSRTIFNRTLINEDKYDEIQQLDELVRELQDETPNEGWGYWHFSLLNLAKENDLKSSILSALSEIPKHIDPYNIDISTGTKTYNSSLDLKNLKLSSVENIKNEIVSKAEHWAHYQGPTTDKEVVSDKFNSLKFVVANKIFDFLDSKEILDVKSISGIDTYYSFGGDHCGDDILVETTFGVYVIHFGFSS